MADIGAYLRRIRSAIYGEEVRGSIHDAIEKINQETEAGLGTAGSLVKEAERQVGLSSAQADRAGENADLARRWAVGSSTNDTPSDTNNSEYYSKMARGEVGRAGEQVDRAKEEVDRAKEQVELAKEEVGRAKEEVELAKEEVNRAKEQVALAVEQANRAEKLSNTMVPRFHIDFTTMELIQESEGVNVEFSLDENKNLSYVVS